MLFQKLGANGSRRPRRLLLLTLIAATLLAAVVVAAGRTDRGRPIVAERWSGLPGAPGEVDSGNVLAWTGFEVLDVGWDHRGGTIGVGGAALDPRTGSWRVLPFAALTLRQPGPLAGTWTGDRLVIVASGGTPSSGTGPVALAYRPGSDGWEPLPAPPIAGGWMPTVLWTGRAVVAWDQDRQAAAVLHPGRREWRVVAEPGRPSGRFQSGYAAGHDLLAVDAAGSGAVREAWLFDGRDERWKVAPLPPVDVPPEASAWTGSRLLLLQRACEAPARLATFDPKPMTWSVRRIDPSPLSCSSSYTTLWADRELLLLPTERPAAAIGPTAAGLDPSTGRWRALRPGPDLPRADAAKPRAIWDDAEVIVLGGRYLDSGEYAPGAAYRPPQPLPVAGPSPPGDPPTGVPACTASSLRSTIAGRAGSGSAIAVSPVTITLNDVGIGPCRLEGQPGLELRGPDGSPSPMGVHTPGPGPATSPPGAPVVLDPATGLTADVLLTAHDLAEGGRAAGSCPRRPRPPIVQVVLLLPPDRRDRVPVADPDGQGASWIGELGACGGLTIAAFRASDSTG